MRYLSKRSTPIMSDEALVILGVAKEEFVHMVERGEISHSLRYTDDPLDRVGLFNFWDLLVFDLRRRFVRSGMEGDEATAMAEDVCDFLAEVEEDNFVDVDNGPTYAGEADPTSWEHGLGVASFTNRMRAYHDSLLAIALSVVRQTHATLLDAEPAPTPGSRLVVRLLGKPEELPNWMLEMGLHGSEVMHRREPKRAARPMPAAIDS